VRLVVNSRLRCSIPSVLHSILRNFTKFHTLNIGPLSPRSKLEIFHASLPSTTFYAIAKLALHLVIAGQANTS
jgi:hypothetical protein